jgi:hypothetical protein
VRGIATIVMAAVFCVTSLGLGLASTAKSVEAPLSPVGLDNGNGKVEERMAADRLHASASPGGGVLLCGDLLQNLDFEQGMPPLSTAWSAFKATVPARIETDRDGNKFIRITATAAEGGAGGFPGRVRSQASLGQTSAAEGETVIYDFSLRLGNDAPESAVLWQLFSYGGGEQLGYATPGDGTDPTVWLYKRSDGTFTVSNFYNEATQKQILEIGTLPSHEFVNITISVHWSLDPATGRVDVWVNGNPAGSLTGKPTIISPLTRPKAEMHIGTYGGNNYEAVGSVDFDDVVVVKGTAGRDCS